MIVPVLRSGLGCITSALLTAIAFAQEQPADTGPLTGNFPSFDLEIFLSRTQLDAQRASAIRGEWDKGTEQATRLDRLLRELHPEYAAAVAQAEAGEPRAALALAEELDRQVDPTLRAYLRYHLARVFLDGDDPQRAQQVLVEQLLKGRGQSPLDAEAGFFYCKALAAIPKPGPARNAFEAWLVLFPNAPETFRSVAMEQVAELSQQLSNPVHGLADQMQMVERSLRQVDTGEATQRTQAEIVARLEKIVAELEVQEQAQAGAPSGNQEALAPAADSALPEGEARTGSLQDIQGVADRWGQLRDADREAISAEVETKLPSHYRKWLQEYYKRLGRGRK